MKEFIITIDSLQKWKSADSKGIKAQDLKGADEETTKFFEQAGLRKDQDDGSSDDVQTCCPRKQRMEN